MQNKIYLISLFDLYGELFTEKQKNYFEDYYFDDLSLSEISDIHNVSRNAAYKQIKEVEKKLIDYESKLKMYNKKNEILKIIKDDDLRKKIFDIL